MLPGSGAASKAAEKGNFSVAPGTIISLTFSGSTDELDFHPLKHALPGRDSGMRFLEYRKVWLHASGYRVQDEGLS